MTANRPTDHIQAVADALCRYLAVPSHPSLANLEARTAAEAVIAVPVPMILTCPSCNGRHIDEGKFATKAHHTHACQHCGMVWRPTIGPTVGVQFLPGYKNDG